MKAIDKLRVNWSKREEDLMVHFPLGQGTKSDGRYLIYRFDDKFVEEISKRGYDITTFRVSIEPKQGDTRFASQRTDES